MIPVSLQPEPEDFNSRIRLRGQAFLTSQPPNTNILWRGKEFWREAIPWMNTAYCGYCAYLAIRIPQRAKGGEPTIDHFISRSQQPQIAYEWTNFRLATRFMNTNKGTKNIIDPFAIQYNWFVINFSINQVQSAPQLPIDIKQRIDETIQILKFNEEECSQARRDWVKGYINGQYPFEHLRNEAPFIAYELERQDLIEQIKIIWHSI